MVCWSARTVTDPADLTDDELLAEITAEDDPDEVIRLRAAAAQRGLWSSARLIPLREKQRISDDGGGR